MKASLKPFASGHFVSIHSCRADMNVLTLAVGETDGQGLGLRLALTDVGSGVPDPTAVAAYVGRQLHVGDNYAHLSIRLCICDSCLIP
jgi:hypothetical protein